MLLFGKKLLTDGTYKTHKTYKSHSHICLMSRRQLPARRRDVLSTWSPDKRRHVAVNQNFLKAQDAIHRRRSIRQFGRGVVRDQVHFRPNAVEQFHQPPRVFIGIVDAVEHHVFESQPLAFTQRVLAAGLHQIRERVLAVYRHQSCSLLFGSGRERDRQARANRLSREIVNPRDDARSRDGDALRADAKPFLIGHNSDCFHYLVIVQKSFTHSHKHQVHAVRRLLARAINFVQHDDDLRDDLARAHAAFDAQLRGHAEAASNSASYLATDADGVAPLFGHKYGLGFSPIAEFEQVAP